MHKLKLLFTMLMIVLFSAAVQAQESTADNVGLMRSNGKIYVVVAIVVTILLGLFFYVINLDRKISRMEKNN